MSNYQLGLEYAIQQDKLDELSNYRNQFHISKDNDITLVVSSKQHMIPYGTVKLTKEGHLKEILEKPKFTLKSQ